MRTCFASGSRSPSTSPISSPLATPRVKCRLSKLRSYAAVDGDNEDIPITISSDKEWESIADSPTHDQSVPSFQSYSDKSVEDLQVSQDLLHYIGRKRKAAKSKKIENGYIYAFVIPTVPGFVKIGMTKEPPQKRINNQSARCKLVYQLIYDHQGKSFPHFAIVEKLIAKDLQNYRRKFTCSNCKRPHAEKGTEHGEWYEIDEEAALRVIEKWRQWIVKYAPYTPDQRLHAYWADAVSKGLMKPGGVKWPEWLDPAEYDRVRYAWMRYRGGRLHTLMVRPGPSMLESLKIQGPAYLAYAIAGVVSGSSAKGWVCCILLGKGLDWCAFFWPES